MSIHSDFFLLILNCLWAQCNFRTFLSALLPATCFFFYCFCLSPCLMQPFICLPNIICLVWTFYINEPQYVALPMCCLTQRSFRVHSWTLELVSACFIRFFIHIWLIQLMAFELFLVVVCCHEQLDQNLCVCVCVFPLDVLQSEISQS